MADIVYNIQKNITLVFQQKKHELAAEILKKYVKLGIDNTK